MILDANFEQRKEDVETHFRCLSFIDSIETHKGIPVRDPSSGNELQVDQQMQCCIKAQTLVLLYNMVESTICDCLNYIYDAVADDGLIYADLTNEMRNMWTASCRRAKKPEKDLDESSKMPLLAVFETVAINTSGSIDIRKIYDAFEKHGCKIIEDKREECGLSFLTVKSKRNLLAHGNVSFSQCGAGYSFNDLVKMKGEITVFLGIVIEATKKFVDKKRYKRELKQDWY